MTSRASATRAAICAPLRDFLARIARFHAAGGDCGSKEFQVADLLNDFSESALAQAKCLSSVSELKTNNVKARWQETTENDGKPLIISIADGANGLVYSAKKAGVLWLTGNVSVCLSGSATQITLKNTKATSNVPMLARLALPSTQSAQIVNDQIKLGGGGWGGIFVGQ